MKQKKKTLIFFWELHPLTRITLTLYMYNIFKENFLETSYEALYTKLKTLASRQGEEDVVYC